MNGDISDSAKLGIGVMILCFLMGIVFNLFTMTSGVTESGVNQLQGSFNAVSNMAYRQYDNTTVYGSQVLNAINTFITEPMCILVSNRGAAGSQALTPVPSSGFSFSYPTSLESGYYGYALKMYPNHTYLGGVSNGRYIGVLDIDNTAARNTNTNGAKAKGMDASFINKSSKYDSHLIIDSTKTIIGICFELRS